MMTGTNHIVGQRDYHYSATPQSLAALRVIWGQRFPPTIDVKA